MNEVIRVHTMSLIAKRKEESKEWVTHLCPSMEKKLQDNLSLGRHWRVSRSDTSVYEVHCQKYNTMVNLCAFICSCGQWQRHGFPFAYAL